MNPIETFLLMRFQEYLKKEYRGFMFWTGLTRMLLILFCLSMITVVWFIDWWWKLGISAIILLGAIDRLNGTAGKGIFDEWMKLKKK